MNRSLLFGLTAIALGLTACAREVAPVSAPTQAAALPDTIPAGIDPFSTGGSAQTRLDEQGAIAVEVTPLNLDEATGKLEFDVALNTHSIDLIMDLAQLSILTTDTGLSVAAAVWEAPRGGHHTSGTLVFPLTPEEAPLLDTATRLTLTMIDLDAPLRVFEWEMR